MGTTELSGKPDEMLGGNLVDPILGKQQYSFVFSCFMLWKLRQALTVMEENLQAYKTINPLTPRIGS